MAKFYPEVLPNRIRRDPKRSAEVRFYDELQLQLDDSWVVFYSVAWLAPPRAGGPARDGETDFIIAHPRLGVLLVEVKGGVIRYVPTQCQWISRDREGQDHEIDPFNQVRQCKYDLLERIKTFPAWTNEWVDLGHAVAFPHATAPRDGLPPEAPPQIVLDATALDQLPTRLKAVLAYWRGENARPFTRGEALIQTLERLLAPATQLRNPLTIEVNEAEREIIRLTEEQFRLLDFLGRTRRAAIGGCAGSGKTMLATEKARRLSDQGFRTLLTCYSPHLADHLAQATARLPGLEVRTVENLATYFASEAEIPLPQATGSERERLLAEEYPEAFCRAAAARPDLRYDAVLVDEGQDFAEAWWVALEDCLSSGKESVFYVFFDDNQRVYPDRSGIPLDLQPFSLSENVRNTRSIHRLLLDYYQGPLRSLSRGPVGRKVDLVTYENEADLKRALGRTLNRLVVQEGIAAEDIAVLTPRELGRSALRGLCLDNGFQLVEKPSRHHREVFLASIPLFKGLERPVVIVAELDQELPSSPTDRDTLCYVAFSRPRSHLVLLASSSLADGVLTVPG